MEQITKKQIAALFPERNKAAQKGDFGRLVCITGSRNMPGACLLSTQAALRCGAGLVTVATVKENPLRLAATAPEAMWLSLESDEAGFLSYQTAIEPLSPYLKKADAVLLGCGLGHTEETCQLVQWIMQTVTCPLLLDADGLNAVADRIDCLKGHTNLVLTPHPGEMARLCGDSIPQIQAHRPETAREFVERYGVTLVLKGAGTLVAQPGRILQNPTGNPGMSRGGSGDVLAGMIASFLTQGLSSWDAACAGVYLHGMAGDIAAKRLSQQAMLPRDILDCLPEVFLRLPHTE